MRLFCSSHVKLQIYRTRHWVQLEFKRLEIFSAAIAASSNYQGKQPASELTSLVALIRRVCGMDTQLTDFDDTVRRNFQSWIMKHHAGNTDKFNEEQMHWLHMIRDHIASSIHIERDDLEMSPFDGQGGLGKMYKLFGADTDKVLDELNDALAAWACYNTNLHVHRKQRHSGRDCRNPEYRDVTGYWDD